MTSSTSNFRLLSGKLALWLFLFLLVNRMARGPVERVVEGPVAFQKDAIARFSSPVVVLGDSHCLPLGLSDENILNLADGGDSLSEMRAKLDYLLRQGHRPRRVVLQMDWHSFSSCARVRNNRQQGELYVDATAYEKIYGEKAWKLGLRRRLFTWLPLLNPINARLSRRYLAHALFPETVSQDWGTTLPAERENLAAQRYRVHYSLPWDSSQIDQVKGIQALCETYDIELVGLRLPLAPRYLEMVQTSDEFLQGKSAVSYLGLPVLDFSGAVKDDRLFVNQDHLRYGVDIVERIRAVLQSPHISPDGPAADPL